MPIEVEILRIAAGLARAGQGEFYGLALAKQLHELGFSSNLAAFGTVYKALDRLEERGMLRSREEDREVALAQRRPQRTLYRITDGGRRAVQYIPVAQGQPDAVGALEIRPA